MASNRYPYHGSEALDEDKLRQISRHVKTMVPSNGTDSEEINKFVQLFDSVFSTCSLPNLSAAYRVAAWNTLCALIDWTVRAEDQTVRSLLWTAGLWQRSRDLYLDHSEIARPRSSRQLLISLATALRMGAKDHDESILKQRLCERLLHSLVAPELHKNTKASLNLLAHLLSKNILSFELLSSSYVRICEIDKQHAVTDNGALEGLLLAALEWISKADFPSIVGQLISTMLDKSSAGDSGLTSKKPPWAAPLQQVMRHGGDNIDAYRSHVFPVLFRRDGRQYAAFVQSLGLGQNSLPNGAPDTDDSSEDLLAAALQSGKSLGLVRETEKTEVIIIEDGCVLVPLKYMVAMLQSSERGIRIAGLAMLIDSPSITKPIHTSVLKQLRRSLPHFHADTDANFRSELFSLTQRLLDRMRASAASLSKAATSSGNINSAQKVLKEQVQFVNSYLLFLAWELRPTASYQRHISALKCLSLLLRSGIDESIPRDCLTKSASGDARWPFHISLIDSGIQRLLIDLLMDPFDDVRQSAAAILSLQSSSATSTGILPNAIEGALQSATSLMLASGRADHADGVAHLHSLSYMAGQGQDDHQRVLNRILEQAERMLKIADDDLATAVDKFPLHGLLTSLRYILVRYKGATEQRTALYDRLLGIVQHVWQVVKPTLCDDAPEGYLPEEMEDLPEVTTKDVLSYCWRALKEASLLIGTMLTPAIMQSSASRKFSTSVFDLCFRQLAELRHRGAFSTVAQTWVACCALMTHDDSAQGLNAWHGRAMDLLRTSLTINTRRSAGLPSLICGILIAAKSDRLFDRAFADLEAISRNAVDPSIAQEGSLPQVHAMNCMKDILKNTRLAETSERYVSAALRLAADSLRSQAWAIRNCGLMLFRAVIDRLLGTNDAYLDEGLTSKKRVEFGQQPELLDLVIGLLSVDPGLTGSTEGARNEGVFPALQLLQRAQIPVSRQDEVSEAVFQLTVSPSWHIRDKAARTYVSFRPVTQVAQRFNALLSISWSDQNALHGALLCARYLLQRLHARLQGPLIGAESAAVKDDVRRCWDDVQRARETHSVIACPYILTAFADVEIMAEENVRLLASSNAALHDAEPFKGSADVPSTIPEIQGDIMDVDGLDYGSLDEQAALKYIRNATDADEWLQARANHLEQSFLASSTLDTPLTSALHEWTQACRTSLEDTSVFSREAAATGLSAFKTLWLAIAQTPPPNPLFLHLCLIIYDLLTDDDEAIRISAATTTCRILSTTTTIPISRLVPLIASQRLASFLLTHFSASPLLASTALSRAFGLTSAGIQPINAQLDALQEQTHALFAEEKQNLYIDAYLELRLWAQIAARVAPQTLQDSYRNGIDKLAHWTLASLSELTTRFETQTSGPLSWTSDAEAFVIGLRAVYAAETLLTWAGAGVRLVVRPSDIKTGLVKFLGVVKKGGWEGLWAEEVQRVVVKALVPSMVGRAGVVEEIVVMGESGVWE